MAASKPKVLIVNRNSLVADMFRRHGWDITDALLEADLVQYTGGLDVHPSLYGQPVHKKTIHNINRDKREMAVFQLARQLALPQAGICRGGQFLNVMCGGKLYQHINNHVNKGTHAVKDILTGEVFEATSTHHQMMAPGKGSITFLTANVCTWVEEMKHPNRENFHIPRHPDIEGVVYKKDQCLCFQPHPEFQGHDALAERYMAYLSKYLDI